MKRLLIVKLSSFGDVLHALPVVKSIKNDLPGLHIGWVVRRRCANLLDGCEFVDNIFVIPDHPTLTDLLKLRSKLVEQNYDTAFDMQGLLLSGVVTLLSGAVRRVGLNRNREMNALFLTEPTVEGKSPRHAIDILLGFRAAAELAPISELPLLTHLGDHDDWLPSLLQGHSARTVAMNVGASTIYKRWPLERWIALGKAFVSERITVILTAGPSEQQDADTIERGVNGEGFVVNLAGRTTQMQLADVFRRSNLVISGDTGPLHLATSVGASIIALFGPTDPRLTGPYGPNHQVIWKQIACSPCFRHPTCNGRVDCLRAISSEEVFASAMILFESQSGSEVTA